MKPDVAIIGAGYVGVPLAHVFAEAGKRVLLVDTAESVVSRLNRGESHIDDVPSETLARHVQAGMLAATSDYDGVRDADAVLVALPTPLSKQREPDLSVVVGGVREVAKRLREGHLVVLESTTYPGTTRECVLPILERTGLKVGDDFNLAFSPERFKPGPGLGGHCIPIDPFYLTWKAREYNFYTEFIELAGKVNENMPYFCRSLISQALNHGAEKSLKGARVLVLGVAYKADIGDIRESPALKIIQLLQIAGSEVSYHDPHVPQLPEHGLSSVGLDPGAYDCVVIITAHSSIDYDKLVEE